MSWEPPDDIYPAYSLFENFGYGPKGEARVTRRMLSGLHVDPTDEYVKYAIELTRDLLPAVREKCQREIETRREFIREELIVGGFIPPDVELVKFIVILIIGFLKEQNWIITAGSKVLKAILDRLRQKKNTSNLERLAMSALEKIESDDVEKIIVEKTETITVRVKKSKKAKPRKQASR